MYGLLLSMLEVLWIAVCLGLQIHLQQNVHFFYFEKRRNKLFIAYFTQANNRKKSLRVDYLEN